MLNSYVVMNSIEIYVDFGDCTSRLSWCKGDIIRFPTPIKNNISLSIFNGTVVNDNVKLIHFLSQTPVSSMYT